MSERRRTVNKSIGRRRENYEDSFNIQFDEDETDKKGGSKDTLDITSDEDKFISSVVKNDSVTKNDKFDPFGLEGRQSAPLPVSDLFVSDSGRASAPIIKLELVSEDQQLAWAAKESLRLEEDRRRRQLQEQADLELAISLSKAEQKL